MRHPNRTTRQLYWENLGVDAFRSLVVALPIAAMVVIILGL
ncbi:hypothetical protein [Ensifer sp. 4252]